MCSCIRSLRYIVHGEKSPLDSSYSDRMADSRKEKCFVGGFIGTWELSVHFRNLTQVSIKRYFRYYGWIGIMRWTIRIKQRGYNQHFPVFFLTLEPDWSFLSYWVLQENDQNSFFLIFIEEGTHLLWCKLNLRNY